MHFPAQLLRSVTLSLAMLAPGVALAEPNFIYVVRHAEKAAEGKDPELTAQGLTRARNLAGILQRAGIGSIFSSPTQRTKQTAQALAERSGLSVQTYDPRAPKELVEKVKALTGSVLVVGHSNTVPDLVRMFGGAPGADIADNEYDRLYQLVIGPNGAVTTILLTSLPETGAKP